MTGKLLNTSSTEAFNLLSEFERFVGKEHRNAIIEKVVFNDHCEEVNALLADNGDSARTLKFRSADHETDQAVRYQREDGQFGYFTVEERSLGVPE